MFTGLVEATGTIVSITPSPRFTGPTRIVISAPSLAPRLNLGDSIAVSGVCLTALDITPTQFAADLAGETIRRTKLTRLAPGALVNLELPTAAGSPLGGHVVQGHVDGVATLISLDPLDPSPGALTTTDWRLAVQLPADLARYVVPQGSITLDGISLTVARLDGATVEIAIIPHTYAATAIRTLFPGSPINVEVDVLSKYARQKPAPEGWTLTESYLLANGY